MNLSTVALQVFSGSVDGGAHVTTAWAHIGYPNAPAPTVDEADNVDGDWDERAANKEGCLGFQRVEDGLAQVLIRAPGFEDKVVAILVPTPPDALERVALEPIGESGPLTIDGTSFIDDRNRPWLFAGYSTHLLMVALKQGVDIRPILREAKGYGFNTIITIGTHLSTWKREHGYYLNPLDAGYQDLLGQLFGIAASERMRVAHAILADAQGLTLQEKRQIVRESAEVAKDRWNVLLRKGNEHNVNGWHPSEVDLGDVGRVLRSQGSAGENNPPYAPALQWAEWEPRRSPIYKAMDDCGAGVLELHNGYFGNDGKIGPFACPIVGIEPAFFNDTDPDHVGDHRWTQPGRALQMGLELGANSAGGGFGASLALESQPLGPIAAECARQFVRGMKASFVRYSHNGVVWS